MNRFVGTVTLNTLLGTVLFFALVRVTGGEQQLIRSVTTWYVFSLGLIAVSFWMTMRRYQARMSAGNRFVLLVVLGMAAMLPTIGLIAPAMGYSGRIIIVMGASLGAVLGIILHSGLHAASNRVAHRSH